MTAADRYELAADAVLQVRDGEALIVNLNAEDMFALNDTGTQILQRIAGGMRVTDVIDELCDSYAADAEDVGRDVHALVAELLRRGLLVAVAGGSR